MFEPIKVGIGQWLGRAHAELWPTTVPMHEFCRRPSHEALAWAPGRMIDTAEDMLAAWARSDATSTENKRPYKPIKLPVIIAAMARDHVPTGHDYTRAMTVPEWVVIPTDTHERVYQLRTSTADLRVQVCIFSHDEPTARSIAAQLQMFIQANRRFSYVHDFDGIQTSWPVALESDDIPAMNVPTDAKNMTVLALDLTLRATVPMFKAPDPGHPNDGKPAPAGWPVIQQVRIDAQAKQFVMPDWVIGQ